MPDNLENAEANMTPRMRNLVSLLWSEWKDLEQQIVAMNEEIEQIASSDPACQRLRQICSPHKGRIHLRRPVNRLFAFPCSRAADHTFGMFERNPQHFLIPAGKIVTVTILRNPHKYLIDTLFEAALP